MEKLAPGGGLSLSLCVKASLDLCLQLLLIDVMNSKSLAPWRMSNPLLTFGKKQVTTSVFLPSPLTLPFCQLLDLQLGDTLHWNFTPLIPGNLSVTKQAKPSPYRPLLLASVTSPSIYDSCGGKCKNSPFLPCLPSVFEGLPFTLHTLIRHWQCPLVEACINSLLWIVSQSLTS